MRAQALSQRAGLHGRRPSGGDPKGLTAALQRWPATAAGPDVGDGRRTRVVGREVPPCGVCQVVGCSEVT